MKGNEVHMATERCTQVTLVARKTAEEKAFTAEIEAETFDEVFCGLQALIKEICSVTGLPVERVIALLAARMLAE